MRYKKKEEKKSDVQNVQKNNWQDEGSQNVEESNIAVENVEAEGKEQIPQLTDSEKKALDKWRNSKEMQKGLRAILPTDDKKKKEKEKEDPKSSETVTKVAEETMSDDLKNGIEKSSGVSISGKANYGTLSSLQPKDKARIRGLIDD